MVSASVEKCASGQPEGFSDKLFGVPAGALLKGDVVVGLFATSAPVCLGARSDTFFTDEAGPPDPDALLPFGNRRVAALFFVFCCCCCCCCLVCSVGFGVRPLVACCFPEWGLADLRLSDVWFPEGVDGLENAVGSGGGGCG